MPSRCGSPTSSVPRSVAFPGVSMGIYRWPVDDGTRIAVEAVRGARTDVAQVRFVAFSPAVEQAFRAALER